MRLYESCFPHRIPHSTQSSTAIKKGLQEPHSHCLGIYETLPYHYRNCEKPLFLRRKRLSLGFLICTEKPWEPLFNILGRYMAYFQSSGILMSWKRNTSRDSSQGLEKEGASHSLPAKLSALVAWEAHSRNYWSALTRQRLESGVWKGSPSIPAWLWLHQSDNDCIMFKGIHPNYSFRLSSLYGAMNPPIYSKLAIKDCLLSWKIIRVYSQPDNGCFKTQTMSKILGYAIIG